MIEDNSRFLIAHPSKAVVLDALANGLRGDWGVLPTPGLRVKNFLRSPVAVSKCRERFLKEVAMGRMLGGLG